ncbi:predicted protein [Postia placenta Mad-698-R]|uniref:Uncharacterized protein n=1 Tax=Postia placenta MAD-698-R-SB12 TaxID=670580 RepID=A0A1X6MJF0_9APHY|nr:hypothetical protein POSPLADRAFT_1050705 [Postia placenta MAD-698-R-SB12]EED79943.1 predicted protein [Postia placenta Mad-698-R]OSX56504.1 hypothetical protein POSPLADRAFT_1050705 [Postia placenta MAD-698-R-SB12]
MFRLPSLLEAHCVRQLGFFGGRRRVLTWIDSLVLPTTKLVRGKLPVWYPVARILGPAHGESGITRPDDKKAVPGIAGILGARADTYWPSGITGGLFIPIATLSLSVTRIMVDIFVNTAVWEFALNLVHSSGPRVFEALSSRIVTIHAQNQVEILSIIQVGGSINRGLMIIYLKLLWVWAWKLHGDTSIPSLLC